MLSIELGFGDEEEIVLIFMSDNESMDEGEYFEFFETGYGKHLRPDRVVYLFPAYLKSYIKKIFRKNSLAYQGAIRHGAGTSFSLVAFDIHGSLFEIDGQEIWGQKLPELKRKFVSTGILKLSELNKVIEIAPPGTLFQKPSNSLSSEFIASGKLCNNSCEEYFLAFCMLSMLPANTLTAKDFYIDTSSISYLISALTKMLRAFGLKECFTHKSFSSYSGLEKAKPDSLSNVFVMISASGSNDLMNKVTSTWGLPREKILTVLSCVDDDRVLCNIKSLSKIIPTNITPERKVRRFGEHFATEILSPKPVVIMAKHADAAGLNSLKMLNSAKAFVCHKTKFSQTSRREIYIDLLRSKGELRKFSNEWVQSLVISHIPAAAEWLIIDPRDEFSKEISLKIKKLTARHGTKLKIISFSDVEKTDFNGSKAPIVALVPVISSGNIFVSLNRDLRHANHNGMRIFATLFHLYKGHAQKKVFERSLTYGPNFTKYKFLSGHEINLPNRIGESSWDQEYNFIQGFQDQYPFWESRFTSLSNSAEGLNGKIGVNGSGADKVLTFSRDFAFWNFLYKVDDCSPESVYATVSATLQAARDSDKLSSDESLRGDIYQLSVLSPEVFVRYNDPLLQSCFWRSANPAELDYSSDHSLSMAFSNILMRLLANHNDKRGEAAIDLLLGICIGRIRLNSFAIRNIEPSVEKIVGAFDYYKPLLLKLKIL